QKGGATLLSTLRHKLIDTPAPNKQESFLGVLIGVIESNIDPEGLGRVWVSLPHLSDKNISNWARLSATSKETFFLPDRGAEVLVAFEQGDINRPYILGELWNGQRRAPETHVDGLNRIRQIATPAGHQVRFDDTQTLSKLAIRSASGHEIVLDDSPPDKALTITHADGSVITLKGGPTGG